MSSTDGSLLISKISPWFIFSLLSAPECAFVFYCHLTLTVMLYPTFTLCVEIESHQQSVWAWLKRIFVSHRTAFLILSVSQGALKDLRTLQSRPLWQLNEISHTRHINSPKYRKCRYLLFCEMCCINILDLINIWTLCHSFCNLVNMHHLIVFYSSSHFLNWFWSNI